MKRLSFLLLSPMLLLLAAQVSAEPAAKQYQMLTKLQGQWKLAPASMQEGKATKNKNVAPLVGTDKVAMDFKVIGKGSTVQENLLPGTAKEMATMYHCDNAKNCNQVKATHYCAKRNQPQLVAKEESSGNTITMSCDMNSELCKSREGHVHSIKHELSKDNMRLKTTYTIFKDGKFEKDSIYHFSRLSGQSLQ